MATQLKPQDIDTTQTFVLSASQFGNGVFATPSITFSSENTLGFWRIGSGNVGYSGTKLTIENDAGELEFIRTSNGRAPYISVLNANGGLRIHGANNGAGEGTTIAFQLETDSPSAGTFSLQVLANGQFQFLDGSASSPILSFLNDPDTGFYALGGNRIGISVGGSLVWAFTAAGDFGTNVTGKILAGDGTVASPGYQFNSDSDTGMYRFGANEIGISCGGSLVEDISNAGIDWKVAGTTTMSIRTGQTWFLAGTLGAPSLSFITDQDTGLRLGGSGVIDVVGNGVSLFDFNPTVNRSKVLFQVLSGAVQSTNGTVSVPAYSFAGNSSTGLYRGGVGNALAVTVNGIDACYFTEAASPQLQVSGGSVSAPTYSFGSYPGTGLYTAGANQLAIATGGAQAAQFNVSGSSDATTYSPFAMYGGNGFGGSGQNGTSVFLRTTAAVSTSPVIIGPTVYGLILVTGIQGTNIFTDLLLTHYNTTPVVVVSSKNTNSPTARTYGQSGDQLTLTMASGTYTISFNAWSMGIR